jgi:hypothetical protein
MALIAIAGAANAKPQYQLDAGQNNLLSMSHLYDDNPIAPCQRGSLRGKVVHRDFERGVRLTGFAIEVPEGDRMYINVSIDDAKLAEVEKGWIFGNLPKLIRDGQQVDINVAYCGAAGRMMLLDGISQPGVTRPAPITPPANQSLHLLRYLHTDAQRAAYLKQVPGWALERISTWDQFRKSEDRVHLVARYRGMVWYEHDRCLDEATTNRDRAFCENFKAAAEQGIKAFQAKHPETEHAQVVLPTAEEAVPPVYPPPVK